MATGSINISSNISRSEMMAQSYPPKACNNLTAKPSDSSVLLTWKDPENYTSTDGKEVIWKYTRIVRKTDSYPINENDGTVVIESSIKNQYQINAYTDSGLTNYTTYYYRAFSCSTDGVYNHEQIQATAQPIQYRVMTVKINLANSNPAKCGSYADDASTMSSGKDIAAWKDFFGYRVCMFKDGKVVEYLDPANFTKFENGSNADITSGNAGDVMVQFPRRGVRISKSGKVVTVSMTDNPSDPSFKYYAHQRGSINKDYFYLGAYDGWVGENKLRSLSGKTPSDDKILAQFDKYGKANGTGYGIMGYYQWLFIQVMYILQFKGNLNSQSTVGYGNSSGRSAKKTGRSNTNGMIYGDNSVVKLFGIEDAWGNVAQFVNNYYSNSNYHVTTTTDDTVTDVNKYVDRGFFGRASNTSSMYYTDCMGTTEAGFTITSDSFDGSSSTYFCDYACFISNCILNVGGYYNADDTSGLFSFSLDWTPETKSGGVGARLQYL